MHGNTNVGKSVYELDKPFKTSSATTNEAKKTTNNFAFICFSCLID